MVPHFLRSLPGLVRRVGQRNAKSPFRSQMSPLILHFHGNLPLLQQLRDQKANNRSIFPRGLRMGSRIFYRTRRT